jgi:hypothetical protein
MAAAPGTGSSLRPGIFILAIRSTRRRSCWGAASFFGFDIRRDGPPGSDYYTVPDLLPLGNLLKFSYLHDGDPDDSRVVGESIDERRGTTDIPRIMNHGGRKFLGDYLAYSGENGTTR